MLLTDLHIHTTWSDGRLSIPEVVDLFGRSGHDVIAITDHIVNSDNLVGRVTHRLGFTLTRENFDAYRTEIEREAKRAWDEYSMIVIAGAELTQNRVLRRNSAHVLAIDIDDYVSAEGTVEDMLVRANDAGAVVVACHPHEQSEWFANTFYLWNRRNEVANAIHLWELACRWDLFPPVARSRMRFIGNSDFHVPPHLYAWKTLLDCDRTRAGVVRTLQRGTGIAITRLEPVPDVDAVAAFPATAIA